MMENCGRGSITRSRNITREHLLTLLPLPPTPPPDGCSQLQSSTMTRSLPCLGVEDLYAEIEQTVTGIGPAHSASTLMAQPVSWCHTYIYTGREKEQRGMGVNIYSKNICTALHT